MTGQRSSRTERILFVDHTAVLGGAELSLLDLATEHRERGAVALFEDGPFAAALAGESDQCENNGDEAEPVQQRQLLQTHLSPDAIP